MVNYIFAVLYASENGKCPKPSGQTFRPTHPNGQCPNVGAVNAKVYSLTSSLMPPPNVIEWPVETQCHNMPLHIGHGWGFALTVDPPTCAHGHFWRRSKCAALCYPISMYGVDGPSVHHWQTTISLSFVWSDHLPYMLDYSPVQLLQQISFWINLSCKLLCYSFLGHTLEQL